MEKKLYRDETRKVIGGVCAGLADYFSIDVSIIRAVFLLTLILKGGGLLIYFVLWIVLPKKTFQFNQPSSNQPFVDYTVPPAGNPQDPQPFNLPKQKSNASVVAGCVLVLLGAFFILKDMNLIPYFDFGQLWPLILIGIGIVVMFSGSKKQPWEHKDWDKQQDNSNNDNPPTI